MIYFTSDLHFWHRNVIEYEKRPFADLEEMHHQLIKRWNAVVSDSDTIYVVGDFAFCGVSRTAEIVRQLNGEKKIVIGNHDLKRAQLLKVGFVSAEHSEYIQIGDHLVAISHYPYLPKFWQQLNLDERSDRKFRYMGRYPGDAGGWLIHGHVHSRWRLKDKMICVAVENWDYSPVSIDTVRGIIEGGLVLPPEIPGATDHPY